jgi:imidazoleglycerol-phosphate dehydratase/histidinol-phosphatase
MTKEKIIFLDRDGTLIVEPEDEQVDSLEKLELVPKVIPSLLKLQNNGFKLVIISNQDGLGSAKYTQEAYDQVQRKMLSLFSSQGIHFKDILVCPHLPQDNCQCRKPKLGLVLDYLKSGNLNLENSYLIGDRTTDLYMAKDMGIQGILLDQKHGWEAIVTEILTKPRIAHVKRETKETTIELDLNLDGQGQADISTGIGFFDHCLEQLAKHSGFDLTLKTSGDVHVDLHHTIEDTAIVLGQAIGQALGDKLGIARYGFVLPMDEAQATIALDLCNRTFFQFEGDLRDGMVGEFPVEMTQHFFRSLADGLRATLHIKVTGDNTHHMIEAIFKGLAKTLKMACSRTEETSLPSTKGLL